MPEREKLLVLPFELVPSPRHWFSGRFKGGLAEEQVEVDFDEVKYARRSATPALEAGIADVWEARRKAYVHVKWQTLSLSSQSQLGLTTLAHCLQKPTAL